MSIALAGVLEADTVLLVNSDRLSGEIQKLEDKRLHLKTAYAGVIEIDWSMVEGITSDQTLNFTLRDGRTVTGDVQGSKEGLQVSSLPPQTLILPQAIKIISKPEEGETFWSHWDGSVELGYSRTRGNSNISQSSVRIPVKWGTDSGACGAASERSDAGYGHDLKVPHISQDFLHF